MEYGTCYSNTKTWSRNWCQSLLKCWASGFAWKRKILVSDMQLVFWFRDWVLYRQNFYTFQEGLRIGMIILIESITGLWFQLAPLDPRGKDKDTHLTTSAGGVSLSLPCWSQWSYLGWIHQQHSIRLTQKAPKQNAWLEHFLLSFWGGYDLLSGVLAAVSFREGRPMLLGFSTGLVSLDSHDNIGRKDSRKKINKFHAEVLVGVFWAPAHI